MYCSGYIIDRIPFEKFESDERFVVEPCCGSATFLVGASERLRDLLPTDTTPAQRHAYFKRMLRGFEKDPFGREISRLCLALADYPNANGWKIERIDVFRIKQFRSFSRHLPEWFWCNPPFKISPFGFNQTHYAAASPRWGDWNGISESPARQQRIRFNTKIALENYKDIDVLALPDKGWAEATPETAFPLRLPRRRNGNAAIRSNVRIRNRQRVWLGGL